MSVIAENAYVDDASRRRSRGRVFVQLEVNRVCKHFEHSACRENCFLVSRGVPDSDPLSSFEIAQIVDEMLSVGDLVGDFAIPAMEPTDTPQILFETLRALHETPTPRQPVSTGIISTGMRFPELLPAFRQYPLDWVIVSADLPSAGLRPAPVLNRAIGNAIDLKAAGGCQRVCVNTVARADFSDLVEVGLRAQEAGVDQWCLAPFRVAAADKLVPEFPPETMLDLAHRLGEYFNDDMKVFVEVDYDTIAQSVGSEASLDSQALHWRIEHPLDQSAVSLMALSPQARVVRVRWDGALLSTGDIYKRGLTTGEFGHYAPGRLAATIRKLATRDQAYELVG